MNSASVDDPDTLRHILAGTTALLLDFDGPVCSVFAGIPSRVVADQLRAVLADGGHTALPVEVAESADPFDVFRHAATLGPDEASYVEAAFTAHEVEAIPTAAPTPGAHDLIRAWHATGRPLAIVSNNSAAAVLTYLDLHNLGSSVAYTSARENPDADLLKPNPHLLMQAASRLLMPITLTILVGDSVTDMQAACAAGTLAVGYVNKPWKHKALSAAGAAVTIRTISELVCSVRMNTRK